MKDKIADLHYELTVSASIMSSFLDDVGTQVIVLDDDLDILETVTGDVVSIF